MNRDSESRLARTYTAQGQPGQHHPRCPCDECGFERELDAAISAAKAVDLTDEERELLADVLAVDE